LFDKILCFVTGIKYSSEWGRYVIIEKNGMFFPMRERIRVYSYFWGLKKVKKYEDFHIHEENDYWKIRPAKFHTYQEALNRIESFKKGIEVKDHEIKRHLV
jgi:hypothetical protein